LPENSNFILVIHTFGALEDCIEFSNDPLLSERMKQCTCVDSTFFNKFVMEMV
jgi:hypothetical protein